MATFETGCFNVIEPHVAAVITKIHHVMTKRQNVARPDDRPTVRILFHCYGGQNRSAAAALGFIFWHQWRTRSGGSITQAQELMADLMVKVKRERPKVLMKKEDNHENFIKRLLTFADVTAAAALPSHGG